MNKIWIYLPLYLLTTTGACWYLYQVIMCDCDERKEDVVVLEVKPEVSDAFLKCFDDGRKTLEGGLIPLIASENLMSAFKDLPEDCKTIICKEFDNIKEGLVSTDQFYAKASQKGSCFYQVLKSAIAYHDEKLKELAVLGLFFNSGEHNINLNQKRSIDFFLKAKKNELDKVGVLVIGRASDIGNRENNMRLSEKRGQSLIGFVDYMSESKLKTDFIFFGSNPPYLTERMAEDYGIRQAEYEHISVGRVADPDYSKRLNQSVLMVIYSLEDDPFDRVD